MGSMKPSRSHRAIISITTAAPRYHHRVHLDPYWVGFDDLTISSKHVAITTYIRLPKGL